MKLDELISSGKLRIMKAVNKDLGRNTTILLLILFGINITLGAQRNGTRLFDNSFLHEIHFESDSLVDLWNGISPRYVMVDVTIDGYLVDSVGLRIKGFTSVGSTQKPLKIDINEYVSGKKYDGLKKFNLHNNFKDPYLQREAVAYNLYRRAGLPSPRTSYANVFVDGEYRGLYSITEEIDKTFLKSHFPSDKGSLYKGPKGFSGNAIELKEGTLKEFKNFKFNSTASNLGDFVNLDDYMKQLATDIIIGDWDSYAYDRHNFYIYYEPKTERLNFLNWDHNYAFSAKEENMDLYPIGTYPSYSNFIEIPIYKSQYEQTMCELLTYLLEPSYISGLLRDNFNMINSNDHGVLAEDPKALLDYIIGRSQRLLDTLTNLGVRCEDITYPYSSNDLVINEITTISESPNGVPELIGSTGGWIEIYNNTASDITLDKHFYLSNDKNFPKKWNFPNEVIIAPKSYLIVWADNEFHLEGLHTGFQLEQEGGNLLLTYEDLTEIQNINYDKHVLNQGYARFPNGTGDFIIQEQSFDASNSTVLSFKTSSGEEATLYTSLTGDYLSVESSQAVSQILLSDLKGKEMKRKENPNFPLNIKDIYTGKYFIRLEFEDQSYISIPPMIQIMRP